LMLATLPPAPPAPSVVVMPEDDAREAHPLAEALRDAGVSAMVWAEGSMKKRLKKAAQRSIPHVVFVGQAPEHTGTVRLKVMATGQQHTLSPAQAVTFLTGGAL
ncbi:MAG: His/Gly/Thr/Pro-type tRNA ligase C-terminal domain-containing protein, partial [Alphaproteobacteria bacterium]